MLIDAASDKSQRDNQKQLEHGTNRDDHDHAIGRRIPF